MFRLFVTVVTLVSFFNGHTSASELALKPSPVLKGTINVIAANNRGVVVMTDSMLSYRVSNRRGGWAYRQLPDVAQKLFQIDDRTVCTFAGFASVATPAVPDFLNSASAIMGRYKGALRGSDMTTIAEKLSLLGSVFSHYLNGIANMRSAVDDEENYYLELFLAGYDPDGTAKVGSLVLEVRPDGAGAGRLLLPVTLQSEVVPVEGTGSYFVHGQRGLAEQILRNPSAWANDPAISTYTDSRIHGKALSIEQMKSLAISLKQHTSENEPTVGGPTQIAVLSGGHVQSVEQPNFPPVTATGYKFRILQDITFENNPTENHPIDVSRMGDAVYAGPGLFMLYFRDHFTRAGQHLDDAYWGGNVFRECILRYSGGKLEFEDSNQVYDSDLVLSGVKRDSPEVKHLLKDFKWRHVEGLEKLSNAR